MPMNDAAPRAGEIELSIVIKALNEERHIGACLASVLAELAELGELAGEVILADSLSADNTVAIAAGLGVKVVQFTSVADRNCGAALQLGYQHVRGQFVYVLDGDMTLEPGFLRLALAYLRQHPDVAGVGGRMIDRQQRNLADRLRADYYDQLQVEQQVAVLGGGGLYRRSAIEQVGYLSNRWLPAFEEAELAARLHTAGYRLVRLPQPAVGHSGHNETSGQLLRRLWRVGRIDASGAFLRAAVGHPWLGRALRSCWFVFAAPALHTAALLLALLALLAGAPWPAALAGAWLSLWLAVCLALARRKGSLREGMLGILAWHLFTVGAVRGFLRPPGDPAQRISDRILCEGKFTRDNII